ncbi:hypothetical protein JTE90_013659 [Oedothorax gibbosus]|uniref:Uncharacterized protein n=1 Tax=Oedothorax gibbosus TaxID=931172 RepID=A0AAV6VB90_9ARAC|nr:hypothetical protein JTE90_013659 [Oedothorax gibbosus]
MALPVNDENASENSTSLDLNDFTLSKFINLMLDYYKKDYPSPLRMMFYGRCEFEFVLDFYIFIKLKNKHLPTVNLLRYHPELFVYSNFTFGFNCKTRPGGFRIIQEIWRLHSGFWKIEILDYKVTLQRFAPKTLTSLCLKAVDKGSLDKLPDHVSKKLKDIENADEYELAKELDEVIDFKSVERENFLRRMRIRTSDLSA